MFEWHVVSLLIYPKLGIFAVNFDKLDHGFWSSILRYLCSLKSFFFKNFWWRHCTNLWFGTHPIKNPGYAYISIVICLLLAAKVALMAYALSANVDYLFHELKNFTES